jgi:hypothetical protein
MPPPPLIFINAPSPAALEIDIYGGRERKVHTLFLIDARF